MADKVYLFDHSPHLRGEWDYSKNVGVDPLTARYKSNKKVWWVCGDGHNWEAVIGGRTVGRGCPYCSGRFAIVGETDLFTVRPHLSREWDYEKNLDDPLKLLRTSKSKYWWKCSNGHSFQTTMASRWEGRSCFYCTGQLVSVGENDLATTNPESIQFLVTSGDAERVMANSGTRLQWKCKQGHTYGRRVADATKKNYTCPFCGGRRVLAGFNDLHTTHPSLASELLEHSTGLAITYGSERKVEWVCKIGHTYSNSPKNRLNQSQGCPFCSGRDVLPGFNDLKTTHEELSLELVDSSLATSLSFGSMKKVEWVCHYGHKWLATVNGRTNGGSGCPVCFSKTSAAEGKLRDMVGKRFELQNPDHTYRVDVPWKRWKSMQVDIHFKDGYGRDVILEYDGSYWHLDKEDVDLEKTVCLLEAGYLVIRVREQSAQYSLPVLPLEHENLLQICATYSRSASFLESEILQVEQWIQGKTVNDTLV